LATFFSDLVAWSRRSVGGARTKNIESHFCFIFSPLSTFFLRAPLTESLEQVSDLDAIIVCKSEATGAVIPKFP